MSCISNPRLETAGHWSLQQVLLELTNFSWYPPSRAGALGVCQMSTVVQAPTHKYLPRLAEEMEVHV